jgi:hypothetical protein
MAAGVVLGLGCEHSQSSQAVVGTGPMPEGVMNRQDIATERVVDRLSMARCSHEEKCNNIGDGRKFATTEVCMDQMRGQAANQLNSYRCPRGIDQNGLNSCLSTLQEGHCGFEFSLDALNRETSCRESSMCMR